MTADSERRLFIKGALAATVGPLIPTMGSAADPSALLTAPALLEQVASVYASALTYQDTGAVTQTFDRSDRRSTTQTPFSTAYSRSDARFRFEFSVPLPMAPPAGKVARQRRWIIFRKGDQVEQWSDMPWVPHTAASLQSAVAGATGVSGGAAHIIPSLLMPNEIGGRKLTADGEAAIRIEDAALDGRACYRIRRFIRLSQGDFTQTAWIERASFLIHRIDVHQVLNDLNVESVTAYAPVLNAPIPATVWQLHAPESAGRPGAPNSISMKTSRSAGEAP